MIFELLEELIVVFCESGLPFKQENTLNSNSAKQ